MSKSILDFQRFRKRNKNDYNDQKIINVLRQFNKPLAFETIAILCNLRKDKSWAVLKSLQKSGIVKKAYLRKTSWWKLVRE